MKRKGMSEVVATVIMIGLVMAAAAIIWAVVKGMLDENMGNTQNCMGSYDKVKFYSGATCYNSSSGEFYFYVETKDVELTKAVVNIYTQEGSKTIEIPKKDGYSDVREYNETYRNSLDSLLENSGRRYAYNTTQKPESISVVPVIGGTQCDISDTIMDIRNC